MVLKTIYNESDLKIEHRYSVKIKCKAKENKNTNEQFSNFSNRIGF